MLDAAVNGRRRHERREAVVGGPRRSHRRQRDAASPPMTEAEMTALLSEVRTLRMTVGSDLSAAAGAVDAEQPEVAGQILAGDREELSSFAHRVAERAACSDAAANTTTATTTTAETGRARRRVLLGLPAVPLVGAVAMSAAAALAVLGQHSAQPHVPTHRTTTAAPAGHATPRQMLSRLQRVVGHHPNAADVLAATRALHHQLAVFAADAPHDPSQLNEVRHLLSVEQTLLTSHHVPGADAALAQARALARVLLATVHRSALPTPTMVTTPRPTSTRTAPATSAPRSTTSQSPRRHRRTAPPAATPSSPRPTQSPRSSPSALPFVDNGFPDPAS